MLKKVLEQNNLQKIITGLGENSIDEIQKVFNLSDFEISDYNRMCAKINNKDLNMEFMNITHSEDEDNITEVLISNQTGLEYFDFAYSASDKNLNVYGIIKDGLNSGIYYLTKSYEKDLKCKYYDFESLEKLVKKGGIIENHPEFAIEQFNKYGINPTCEFAITGIDDVKAALNMSQIVSKTGVNYLDTLRSECNSSNFTIESAQNKSLNN